MTTDIIAACVLGLWIALGFALHKYFEWQRWDEERRIERIRYVTAQGARFQYETLDYPGTFVHEIAEGLENGTLVFPDFRAIDHSVKV